MEIGLYKNRDRKYRLKYDDGVYVTLRHLDRNETRAIIEQATVADDAGDKKYDTILGDCLLGEKAIVAWEGITIDGEPAPVTAENIRLIMNNSGRFAAWVNTVALNVERMAAEDVEAEKKS